MTAGRRPFDQARFDRNLIAVLRALAKEPRNHLGRIDVLPSTLQEAARRLEELTRAPIAGAPEGWK